MMAPEKSALRSLLKKRRAGLGPAARAAASAAIAERLFALPEVSGAARLFCYISFATEVDTHAILRRLLSEGREVVVPRILDRETMVAQRLHDWDALQSGALGILAPPAGEPWTGGVEVAITPGLGFTAEGDRIGFGAGYYDRWFARNRVGLRVALAFECQLVNSLPSEPTDQRVDLILTEARSLSTRPGDAARPA